MMSGSAESTAKTRVLVSTFAYNEHVKIEATVRRIQEADLNSRVPGVQFDVIVVDDGSTDGFPEELRKKYGFILLSNDRNRGIGYSIRRAINYGLEHGYDILTIMAGNNKDEPLEIPALIQPIMRGEVDFVQGSRYLPGGNYGSMPLYRRVSTQFVHPLLVWIATGKHLHDTTNGFRAIRLEVFRHYTMNLDQEWLDRYGLEYYLLFYMLTKHRFTEVPVTKIYPPKQLGYTKIKPFQGWWDILKPMILLGLRLRK